MRPALLVVCVMLAWPAWAAAARVPLGVVVPVPVGPPREDAAAQVPAPVQDVLRGDPAPGGGGLLLGGAAARPVVMPVLPEIPPEPRDENWNADDARDVIEKEDLPPLPSELGR